MRALALLLAMTLSGAPVCLADTVVCKDGRSWTGLITAETADVVELDLGFDTAKLKRTKISRIDRAGSAERARLERSLEMKRLATQKLLAQRPRSETAMSEASQIYADAVLNGSVKARLLVDTGAASVLLSKPFARKLGYKISELPENAKVQVADGRKLRASLIQLKSLTVGGRTAQYVNAVILLDDVPNANFGDGLLGMSFLSRFHFSIDPRTKKLTLK